MLHTYSTDFFEKTYTYHGNDLGASWSPSGTVFRVWAPTANSISVALYRSGNPECDDLIFSKPMNPDVNGTWVASISGNLNHLYYTYLVNVENQVWETEDPYAKAVGVNGVRSMVIDLQETNPEGWESDRNPNAGLSPVDYVIYELHIRDLSINYRSGIRNKGKFLALTEKGTKTRLGDSTGLDHIKNLGVTHVHLLPVNDFGSVNEADTDHAQYNWGYDPVNFNVPEGSYSTDPYHGNVRISEMKSMVKALHDNGISVIMDVVYNHVYHAREFCMNRLIPGYFSRECKDGSFSNGSGCGNDTASERSMVQKYIIDSVNYWADEFHIDGFRFDLVGLIDTETINRILTSVRKKHPNVFFYGEGWDIPTAVTKENITLATQHNHDLVPELAFFNDTIRDAVRGSVFDSQARGFITGNSDMKNNILHCFAGNPGWCKEPWQIINYISCHDNHTLADRIHLSAPEYTEEEIMKSSTLGAAINLLSQGIPFFQAGEEMLRSKVNKSGRLVENSYCSPDYVNSIKWASLHDPLIKKSVEYYRELIRIRKKYRVFRCRSKEEIDRTVTEYSVKKDLAAAFLLYEKNYRILVVLNASREDFTLPLPAGAWNLLALDISASISGLAVVSDSLSIPYLSAAVLLQMKN